MAVPPFRVAAILSLGCLLICTPPSTLVATASPCHPTAPIANVGQLTPTMMGDILSRHNTARNTTVPTARFMPMLQWSDALAAGIQSYLDTCPGFQHSSGAFRSDTAGYAYVSENLAAGMNFALGGFNVAVDMWINERDAWSYAPGGCEASTGVCGTCTPTATILSCGHYTTAIWNRSTHIGCGYKFCSDEPYKHYYGCWYGPGGNIAGQAPFEAGAPEGPCVNGGSSGSAGTTQSPSSSGTGGPPPPPPSTAMSSAASAAPAGNNVGGTATPSPSGGGNAAPSSAPEAPKDDLEPPFVIGIAAAAVAVVIGTIVGIYCLAQRKKKRSAAASGNGSLNTPSATTANGSSGGGISTLSASMLEQHTSATSEVAMGDGRGWEQELGTHHHARAQPAMQQTVADNELL